MKATFITDRFTCTSVLIALALLTRSTFAAPTTDFQKVLTEPRAFNGKRVTLIGVASISGAEFYLYPGADEARKAGAAVFVDRNLKGPRLDRLSNHWLKVTGIVRAERHGPFNDNPCEVWLERFEVLPEPPLPSHNIYGIFRNDTSTPVNVRIYRPDGYSDFGVPSRSTSTQGIEQHSSAAVTSPSGKLIAKSDLIPSKGQSQYFDSVNRSYYYRIGDSKIELVPPGETKAWKIYRP